jgi:hypothetical protein
MIYQAKYSSCQQEWIKYSTIGLVRCVVIGVVFEVTNQQILIKYHVPA